MEKETGRIEGFSDGVFAIGITLLVLDLHVPELKEGMNGTALWRELSAQWPGYMAFVISFFSIFIVWVSHHKLFKQIYRRNTGLMFANGLILFLVTCVSFPTNLLARFYHSEAQQLSITLYTGLFVLMNLSFNLLWFLASRDRSLLRPDIDDQSILEIRNTYLYGMPTYFAAFALSFFWPNTALLLCILLWVYWAFSSGKLQMKRRRRVKAAL
ncbi:TMEM175 family protein [Pedobacter sp. AW31-3R]|uniref:TMEM175 family protein n=1 Tax=Pedobacter sp. AW31-3R TaxID=3445781 RepID=UPI003F9F472E